LNNLYICIIFIFINGKEKSAVELWDRAKVASEDTFRLCVIVLNTLLMIFTIAPESLNIFY